MEFEDFCFEKMREEEDLKKDTSKGCEEDLQDEVDEEDNKQETMKYFIKKPKRRIKDTFQGQSMLNQNLVQKEFGLLRQGSLCLADAFEDNNFLLFGEIFCYIKSFQRYFNVGSPKHCYLTDFRPVVAVQASLDDSRILSAQLDIQDEGFEFIYQREIDQNMRKIDMINSKLLSLSDQNAFDFSQYLEGYKSVLTQYIQRVSSVHFEFNNDLSTLQDKLDLNFKKSEIKVHQILQNLQNNYPTSLLQFFVKKLDARTLTGKTCKTGGNQAFIELTCGTINPTLIAYQFSRFGAPEALDWRGLVDITMAQFTGENHFQFDIQTLDGYSIPSKATFTQYPLSEIQLTNDFILSDQLVVYIYSVNPSILENLAHHRQSNSLSNPNQFNAIKEDLSYTARSEIFINQFYPNISIAASSSTTQLQDIIPQKDDKNNGEQKDSSQNIQMLYSFDNSINCNDIFFNNGDQSLYIDYQKQFEEDKLELITNAFRNDCPTNQF